RAVMQHKRNIRNFKDTKAIPALFGIFANQNRLFENLGYARSGVRSFILGKNESVEFRTAAGTNLRVTTSLFGFNSDRYGHPGAGNVFFEIEELKQGEWVAVS